MTLVPASVSNTIGHQINMTQLEMTQWASAFCTRAEVQIAQYDGARLTNRYRGSAGTVEAGAARWECSLRGVPVPDRPDAVDIISHFRLAEGTAGQSAAGVVLTFEDWSREHYVVLPAAAYAGNRFSVLDLSYPPMLPPLARGPNVPTIITDVPRLNAGDGPSHIQQLTRDLATPAVGIFDPAARRGFWLLTDPKTRLGDGGLDLEESDDRRSATLSVMAPGVREGLRYEGTRFGVPSEDRGAHFAVGDSVTIRLRLFAFHCLDVPALFDRFWAVRTDLTGPVRLTHGLPFSAAWAIQEEKYNRDNWVEDGGYYSVGLRENIYQDWQVGWVGGLVSTQPLLMVGDEVSRGRARRTFDFAFQGQGASGLFYGIGHRHRWYGDDFLDPGNPRPHLVRKSADALYFLLKQFDLLEKQGQPVPSHWETGVRRCADAFVRLWDENGQFGQFVDADSGEILIGGSTSAGIASAGMTLASERYKCSGYLRVAEEAAEQFYQRDVLAGVTTGGPGEILQCPDSESAFGLLESFVVLYEATGARCWAEKAEDMARQCASWCVSYDWPFPPDSLFGRMGMRAAGSVWANVQNKHSAPGICNLSGDSLLKLFRATGDGLYLDMLRQTAHNITQYLSRADQPVGGMPPGWMNERVNLSDWDNNVGGIFFGSCWCEVSCMLTYAEVPGLYVQPDTGLAFAFDHVDVEIEEQGGGGLRLRVNNPTAYPARIRVLAELSSEASRPLGQNALWGCPVLALAPGEARTLHYPKT